jgi:hypothetical protein
MAKINNGQPPVPQWPWGTPGQVRSRLVDRAAVVDKKRKGRKGDPKNPALPSAALLDSIGPAHGSDELRLPQPPMPEGHSADVQPFSDREQLSELVQRAGGAAHEQLERGLGKISAPPDRMERLKGLLQREAQMLDLLGQMSADLQEIQRRIRDEQKEGRY